MPRRRGRGAAPPPVPNPVVADDPEPDPRSVAQAIVLRQLTMGPRSRAQLERTLRRRGCADEVAAAVLDRMTELGLVDDAAFAEQLVQSRRRTKGLADAALRQELRDKGINEDLVRQTLAAPDPEADRARAEQLVARRLRTMAGLEPQVQTRRLAAMLARKGYPADTAYTVVRAAVDAAARHDPDA